MFWKQRALLEDFTLSSSHIVEGDEERDIPNAVENAPLQVSCLLCLQTIVKPEDQEYMRRSRVCMRVAWAALELILFTLAACFVFYVIVDFVKTMAGYALSSYNNTEPETRFLMFFVMALIAFSPIALGMFATVVAVVFAALRMCTEVAIRVSGDWLDAMISHDELIRSKMVTVTWCIISLLLCVSVLVCCLFPLYSAISCVSYYDHGITMFHCQYLFSVVSLETIYRYRVVAAVFSLALVVVCLVVAYVSLSGTYPVIANLITIVVFLVLFYCFWGDAVVADVGIQCVRIIVVLPLLWFLYLALLNVRACDTHWSFPANNCNECNVKYTWKVFVARAGLLIVFVCILFAINI